MALRLVMMGTGEFALPTLLALYGSDHEVVALFTQPDRTGAGHHHHPHPMKDAALARGTAVLQPQKVNTPESIAELRALQPDLCVVAAYGQILSEELLSVPRLGAINVHASILPRHRGAAPVQYAVLSGDAETGISIFQIEPRLDAGPVLGIAKLAIGVSETAGELENRLAELAAPLTLRVIEEIESGTLHPIPQDTSLVTRAPRIKKHQGAIDWSRSADEIGWHVRGMQPWPTAYTFLKQTGHKHLRLIFLEVRPVTDVSETTNAAPGTILPADGSRLLVQSGHGIIEILRLRPEGKRAMTAAEFLHGHAIQAGDLMNSALISG